MSSSKGIFHLYPSDFTAQVNFMLPAAGGKVNINPSEVMLLKDFVFFFLTIYKIRHCIKHLSRIHKTLPSRFVKGCGTLRTSHINGRHKQTILIFLSQQSFLAPSSSSARACTWLSTWSVFKRPLKICTIWANCPINNGSMLCRIVLGIFLCLF